MNDERPIEKLLRRAAQKRNDEAGVPPELHPANRRLLQAEVARQFPQAQAAPRESAPPFWVALTRRWAYALALIPVIGLLALVLLPSLSKSKSKASMELAKNAPAEMVAAPAGLADAALPPQPTTTTALSFDSAPEPSDSMTLGRSGGGNIAASRSFEPPTVPAASVAGPSFSGADREASARRVNTDSSAVVAGSLGVNRADSAAMPRLETTAGSLTKGAEAESFYRTAPAAVAQPQASPATKLVSTSEAKTKPAGVALHSTGAPARESGVKTEESRVTNYYAAVLKEVDSTTPAPVVTTDNLGTIAATEIAKDGYSDDKAWLARGGGGGGGAERQRATLNSQAFSNLSAEQSLEKKKDFRANKLTPPVLVNFKVEQAGRDLRVVDGDGSVYNGVVDEANTLYKQMAERQQQKLVVANDNKYRFQTPKLAENSAPAKQQLEAEYYLYRVEGTNRSLNQNVVFTWNFVDTNALANGNLNYQNVQQKLDATKLPSQFPALLQNSFINGRAQFGEGREVEVNAVPVQR